MAVTGVVLFYGWYGSGIVTTFFQTTLLQRPSKLLYPTAVDCSVLFYSTSLPIVLPATYVRVTHCGELQRAFYSTIIVGR